MEEVILVRVELQLSSVMVPVYSHLGNDDNILLSGTNLLDFQVLSASLGLNFGHLRMLSTLCHVRHRRVPSLLFLLLEHLIYCEPSFWSVSLSLRRQAVLSVFLVSRICRHVNGEIYRVCNSCLGALASEPRSRR